MNVKTQCIRAVLYQTVVPGAQLNVSINQVKFTIHGRRKISEYYEGNLAGTTKYDYPYCVTTLLSWPLSGSEPILEFRHVPTQHWSSQWQSWEEMVLEACQGALNDHIR